MCPSTASGGEGRAHPRPPAPGSSARTCEPAVVVVEPDYVVLAEVITVLDLDEHKIVGALVLDPMSRASRDVDRLAGPKAMPGPLKDDARLARDDEPMLRSTGMALIAEALPGADDDAFHLVIDLIVQDDISTPRSMLGIPGHDNIIAGPSTWVPPNVGRLPRVPRPLPPTMYPWSLPAGALNRCPVPRLP